MKFLRYVFCVATALFAIAYSGKAFAADPNPGDACSINNSYTIAGGPSAAGKIFIMQCQGGTWQARFTTLANGNVGIGTTNPGSLLEVPGALAVTSLTVGGAAFGSTNGVNVPNLASAPGSPANGQMYFNTTDNKLYVYKNSTWFEVAGGFGTGNSGYVGSLIYAGTTNCLWTSTSASYANFAADTDCPAPSVVGAASAPATKIPGVVFSSLPAGTYRVDVYGTELYSSNSSTTCDMGISDGTSLLGTVFADFYSGPNQVSGIFQYASAQSNITFQMQVKRASGAGTCQIFNNTAGENNYAVVVTRIDGNGSAVLLADADANTRVLVEKNSNEDKIRFDTNGSERMIIDNAGGVGIGTTNPTQRLEVNGNIRVGSQTTRATSTNRGQLALSSTYTVTVNANTTVDWSLGNIQELNTFACNGAKTITMSNMVDGGAYTLLLSGTAAHSGTCLLAGTGLTFKTTGGNVAPTTAKDVVFTFVVINGTVVFNMVDNLL